MGALAEKLSSPEKRQKRLRAEKGLQLLLSSLASLVCEAAGLLLAALRLAIFFSCDRRLVPEQSDHGVLRKLRDYQPPDFWKESGSLSLLRPASSVTTRACD